MHRCYGDVFIKHDCFNADMALHFTDQTVSTLKWQCLQRTWQFLQSNGREYLGHWHFNGWKVVANLAEGFGRVGRSPFFWRVAFKSSAGHGDFGGVQKDGWKVIAGLADGFGKVGWSMVFQKRATSPQPSPPLRGGEGETAGKVIAGLADGFGMVNWTTAFWAVAKFGGASVLTSRCERRMEAARGDARPTDERPTVNPAVFSQGTL
jgi:hypothetical protein